MSAEHGVATPKTTSPGLGPESAPPPPPASEPSPKSDAEREKEAKIAEMRAFFEERKQRLGDLEPGSPEYVAVLAELRERGFEPKVRMTQIEALARDRVAHVIEEAYLHERSERRAALMPKLVIGLVVFSLGIIGIVVFVTLSRDAAPPAAPAATAAAQTAAPQLVTAQATATSPAIAASTAPVVEPAASSVASASAAPVHTAGPRTTANAPASATTTKATAAPASSGKYNPNDWALDGPTKKP
jgi:hypothetical protein